MLKKQIKIRGTNVSLYDQNPAITRQKNQEERREKITVKDIPMSLAQSEVENYLRAKGVTLVRFSNKRDPEGNLTSFKNGDIYVYAVDPIEPILPRMATIGGLRGRLFHNGQFIKKCKLCGGPAHAPGDKCPAANEDDTS